MNIKFLKILIPIFLAVAAITLFFWPLDRESLGATCEITQTFWRTLDGKEYTTLPQPPAIGDKIKAVAKFKNCNISGNKPYFVLFSGSKSEQVGVQVLTSTGEEERNCDFTVKEAGQNYFKAGVEIGGQKFEGISSKVNVPPCSPEIIFDANPKTVTSLDQVIKLEATVLIKDTKYCTGSLGTGMVIGSIAFYVPGKIIQNPTPFTGPLMFSSSFSKKITLEVSAKSLGFQMNQNIQFVARAAGEVKVGGTATGTDVYLGGSSIPFFLVSAPVNVGVGQAPELLKKYQCKDKTCVEDPNGPYDSLEICNRACTGTGTPGIPGAPSGGGAPVTTQYVFNLPNPIGVTNFQDLVNIIGKWIFNLAIPIAVIIIIWAGVLMLTSGGDPGRFKKGTTALWYAVIGLAIVLIGKGFVTLIQSILNLRNR